LALSACGNALLRPAVIRGSPLRYLRAGCRHRRPNRKEDDTLGSEQLPELGAQCDPTLNTLTADRRPPTADRRPHTSKRTIWWLSTCCGHQWQDSPRNRVKYTQFRCPACDGYRSVQP
jgi:hypothetical protein